MSVLKTQRPTIALTALLGLCAATSAWARPNMWWDHFESQAPNQTECVKQAEAILTAENAGQLASDADSVRGWSQQTVAVAECLAFGEKLIVAVLVSSEDASAGNKLFNALRTGMKKP